MKDVEKLRNLIMSKRLEKGYSREKVSELLKLQGIEYNESSITRYENGTTKNIKIEILNGMCEVLNLDKTKMLELAGFSKDIIVYESSVNEMKIKVYGFASAGSGVLSNSDVEEIEILVPEKYKKRNDIFGIKVKGNSMEPEFLNGDILLLDSNIPPAQELNRRVVVVDLNGERFVKQLRYIEYKPFLFSYNEAYPPMPINGNDDAKLVGRLIFLHRVY